MLRGAARLILKRQRSDHISDSMREQLHWLDIRSRIEFKMSLLAFRCLNDSVPRYLAIECSPVAGVTGRSCLRSAASEDILVPACQTLTIGPWAFIAACLGLELSPEGPRHAGHQPVCFQEGTQD